MLPWKILAYLALCLYTTSGKKLTLVMKGFCEMCVPPTEEKQSAWPNGILIGSCVYARVGRLKMRMFPL